ncbi:MAG TPA: cupin-like domain-containing protein [Asticcacaulis sp.]|nr:cupin-like domain-containing protein [Asticcacaulis sp.]
MTPDSSSRLPSIIELTNMDARQFATEILPAARPVVFRKLVRNWPVVSCSEQGAQAVAAYLKSMDNGRPTGVLEAHPGTQGRFAYGPDLRDFNFNRRNRTISSGLDDLLRLYDEPEPPYIYIQSTPTPQHLPGFAADNPNPLLPPAIAPRIWISNATRAQIHNDNDHNIACVAAGRRRFTLFPPEQLVNLYIGPMEHNPSGRAISLANLEEPDFERFPRLAEALKHAQVAELEPGDAIYIPKYWWHHVQSLTPFNVLVNYWWGNSAPTADNPLTPFLAALLALKDVSPADKLYWKTMFDHYIFQTDGDPVAHIPQGHQGGLGPHNAKIRNGILKALQALVSAGVR